jgi:hypothetical protein
MAFSIAGAIGGKEVGYERKSFKDIKKEGLSDRAERAVKGER